MGTIVKRLFQVWSQVRCQTFLFDGGFYILEQKPNLFGKRAQKCCLAILPRAKCQIGFVTLLLLHHYLLGYGLYFGGIIDFSSFKYQSSIAREIVEGGELCHKKDLKIGSPPRHPLRTLFTSTEWSVWFRRNTKRREKEKNGVDSFLVFAIPLSLSIRILLRLPRSPSLSFSSFSSPSKSPLVDLRLETKRREKSMRKDL